MIVTKTVYDFVFRRQKSQKQRTDTDIGKAYTYPCGKGELTGYLCRSPKQCKGLVVFVPGFRAEAARYGGVIREIARAGFDVFSFDCTGCGNSCGKTSVGFPQVINDLNATLTFIVENKSFDYDKIYLFGHSRGGYAACCVVNEHKNISGVISVNGVNHAMDGIMAYSVAAVGVFAYLNYYFLWLYHCVLFGRDIADRSAVCEINKSNVPVLVIQAYADRRITRDRYSLYARRRKVNSPNAEFFLYQSPRNCGHTSILYDQLGRPNKEIILKATDFFKNIPERRRRYGEKHSSHSRLQTGQQAD